jgi:hypothetical protein
MVRLCPIHGETEHFERPDNHGIRCRRCASQSVTNSRLKKKSKLVAAMGGSCTRCGYDKCERALDFHHLQPELKSFGIARRLDLSFAALLAEAKKCILVCANCHMEVHAGLHD